MSDHTIEEAIEIQKEFERTVLPSAVGVLGVGIGFNTTETDYALNVQVATERDVNKLPATFDGLDVVVNVVGSNTALRTQ